MNNNEQLYNDISNLLPVNQDDLNVLDNMGKFSNSLCHLFYTCKNWTAFDFDMWYGIFYENIYNHFEKYLTSTNNDALKARDDLITYLIKIS